jgi:hypothetical protein
MTKIELSELLLYKSKILIEAGDHTGNLKFLNSVEQFIKDRLSFLEYKGTTLLALGKNAEAKKVYRELLKINNENYEYFALYQQTNGLPKVSEFDATQVSSEQAQQLVEFYDKIAKEFPKSAVVKRIPLNFATAEDFKNRITEYAKPFLTNNVPSLFSNLKSLYKDTAKVQIIESVFLEFLDSLENNSQFVNATEKEAPTTYLWTLLYLAYHYDKLGKLELALETINKAVKHTPTAIELYMCKARILKHSGNYQQAADEMELARTMDLADRYLNTKATKYLLRADRTQEAPDVLYLFAKDQEQRFNITDMQGSAFQNDSGDSYLRQKKIGRALKFYGQVIANFEEIRNDQFDFHSYCLRKYMMRSYVDYLQYNDDLESHDYYFRGATGYIKTLLQLHKHPELKSQNHTEEDQQLYEQQLEKKKIKKDEDPFGEKLMNVSDPLSEADKYIKVLSEQCGYRIETHTLAAEVYITAGRYLHAMKALKEGIKLESSNPQLHKLIVQLFHALESGKLDDSASRLIRMQQGQVLGESDSVLKFNENYYANHGSKSLMNTLSYAESSYEVLGRQDDKNKLLSMLLDLNQYPNASLAEVSATYNSLQTVFKDSSAASEFRSKALKLYPQAQIFASEH